MSRDKVICRRVKITFPDDIILVGDKFLADAFESHSRDLKKVKKKRGLL